MTATPYLRDHLFDDGLRLHPPQSHSPDLLPYDHAVPEPLLAEAIGSVRAYGRNAAGVVQAGQPVWVYVRAANGGDAAREVTVRLFSAFARPYLPPPDEWRELGARRFPIPARGIGWSGEPFEWTPDDGATSLIGELSDGTTTSVAARTVVQAERERGDAVYRFRVRSPHGEKVAAQLRIRTAIGRGSRIVVEGPSLSEARRTFLPVDLLYVPLELDPGTETEMRLVVQRQNGPRGATVDVQAALGFWNGTRFVESGALNCAAPVR